MTAQTESFPILRLDPASNDEVQKLFGRIRPFNKTVHVRMRQIDLTRGGTAEIPLFELGIIVPFLSDSLILFT